MQQQLHSNYRQELRRDPNTNDVIYQVSATVQADIPTGSWFTDIWLTTNQASMPKLRVPLAVEVEPKLFRFESVKAGAKTSYKVSFNSQQPFSIIGVQGADQELMVSQVSTGSQIKARAHVDVPEQSNWSVSAFDSCHH